MAYGSKGNPELGVPPDADLVYDVELHSFENVSISNGWFCFIPNDFTLTVHFFMAL